MWRDIGRMFREGAVLSPDPKESAAAPFRTRCRNGGRRVSVAKRILVIKPSSLGDIIHGLMVAQSLREQMEGCSLSWVAADMFAPLVKACSTVDHTLVFPRHGGIRELLSFARALRRQHYDYVLDFQGLARSGLMTALTKAPIKLGLSAAREGAWLAYDCKVPRPQSNGSLHAVEVLLGFLPALGLNQRLGGPLRFEHQPLPPPHETLCAQQPIVVVPHSREPVKEWPGFDELSRLLLAEPGEPPVVWVSHHACPASEQIATHPRFHNLTGQTSLLQMTGLIQAARVVVANDSGPMHVAAAFGRPLVACFGPTPPERYGPYPLNRLRHQVVRAPQGDLKQLEVARVHAAAQALLRRKGTRPA